MIVEIVVVAVATLRKLLTLPALTKGKKTKTTAVSSVGLIERKQTWLKKSVSFEVTHLCFDSIQ